MLKPFSLHDATTLTVDASGKAIGAVLSQNEHPCLFVSRKLSNAEQNYSNIEREALAVLWACTRLKEFLLGKKFRIQTDQKPLIYIFGPNQSLKDDISPRLLRFSVKMMQFDFHIEHIAGKDNIIADALSRIPWSDDHSSSISPVHFSEPCIDLQYLRCLLYTSPSPRDLSTSRMPSSA